MVGKRWMITPKRMCDCFETMRRLVDTLPHLTCTKQEHLFPGLCDICFTKEIVAELCMDDVHDCRYQH